MSRSADILFRTDRFNLSEEKEHFINPCCFGEDTAAWLRDRLRDRQIEATDPDQEDWGWYIEAKQEGRRYFIGVGGASDEDPVRPDLGEWRVMIERKRTMLERLGKANESDGFASMVLEILRDEPGFQDVRLEAES